MLRHREFCFWKSIVQSSNKTLLWFVLWRLSVYVRNNFAVVCVKNSFLWLECATFHNNSRPGVSSLLCPPSKSLVMSSWRRRFRRGRFVSLSTWRHNTSVDDERKILVRIYVCWVLFVIVKNSFFELTKNISLKKLFLKQRLTIRWL